MQHSRYEYNMQEHYLKPANSWLLSKMKKYSLNFASLLCIFLHNLIERLDLNTIRKEL